jgi:hypothetical protein
MARHIGYKRIGLSYAEQINIVSVNGDTVYYIVQKNGRDFGGIHTTSSDRIITEAEAKTSKRIYA